MVWEFTCVNTIAESYLKETSIHPCAAAEKAEKLKKAKYKQLERDYYLVPIAVETFGGWGAEGAALINSISRSYKKRPEKSNLHSSYFNQFPLLFSEVMPLVFLAELVLGKSWMRSIT